MSKNDVDFGYEFLDQIIVWIGDNVEPEEVFTESQLEYWALNNGYVKEE